MSEKKFTKEGTVRVAEVNDAIRDNTLHTVDEIAKVQPQVVQSVSRLQQDTIEASRNMIKTAFDAQKQIASGLNVSVPSQVSEQVVRHSNEIANAFARATGVYNQLVINTLDMAPKWCESNYIVRQGLVREKTFGLLVHFSYNGGRSVVFRNYL